MEILRLACINGFAPVCKLSSYATAPNIWIRKDNMTVQTYALHPSGHIKVMASEFLHEIHTDHALQIIPNALN